MKLIFNKLCTNFLHSRNLSQITKNYDLCIIGGGPIGFGFASLLGTTPGLKDKRIILVDNQKLYNYHPTKEFSQRTVAISPNSRRILEKCDVWDSIISQKFRPVKKMIVWEQTSDSFIKFPDDSDDNENDLAYIVENDVLQNALVNKVKMCKNIDVVYQTSVVNIENAQDSVTLTLSDNTTIESSLLVGCDGFNSFVRKSVGIKSIDLDYKQKAIVAVVKFENPTENNTAWQRFTKTGPIAYLPLDDEHSNLIWSTTSEHVDELMAMNQQEFINTLNNQMYTDSLKPEWLSKLDSVANNAVSFLSPSAAQSRGSIQLPPKVHQLQNNQDNRKSFPLGFMHAERYVSENIALVGDACHRVLPLAGQGANLGLGDADLLVENIVRGLDNGQTINDPLLLLDYETRRQRYVLPVAMTIQALHQLYTNDLGVIQFARSVGLNWVNCSSTIKNWFVKGAVEGQLSILGRPF